MKDFNKLLALLPVNCTNEVAKILFENIDDVFIADTFAIKELSIETEIEEKFIKKSLKELTNLGILKQIHSNRYAKNPDLFNVSENFKNKYQTYPTYVSKRKKK